MSIRRILVIALLVAACSGGDPVFEISLEIGESRPETIATHCGYRWLEVDVNGRIWRSDDLPTDGAGNPFEPTWPNRSANANFILTLLDDEILEVRAESSDVSYRYQPDPSPPGCA